jgi:hypothetical protein
MARGFEIFTELRLAELRQLRMMGNWEIAEAVGRPRVEILRGDEMREQLPVGGGV